MAVGSWIGITLTLWVVAWIIAEAIPVFSKLLSLMVSTFLHMGFIGLIPLLTEE